MENAIGDAHFSDHHAFILQPERSLWIDVPQLIEEQVLEMFGARLWRLADGAERRSLMAREILKIDHLVAFRSKITKVRRLSTSGESAQHTQI